MRRSERAMILLGMWLASALFACSKEEPAEEEDGDVLARAYGGCTSTVLVQRDGLSVGEGENAWNEDGDLVSSDWVLDGLRSEAIYEYGAVHERSRYFVDFKGPDVEDYEWRYVWLDGHIVESSLDTDMDGEPNYVASHVFDERDLLTRSEWDYDGDGVTDDRIDYTWEPDGADWHGQGEGEDPEGIYTIEFWTRPDGDPYRYLYDDDREIHHEWELSERNALGVVAHSEERSSQLGVYEWEEISDIGVDEIGRPQLEATQLTFADTVYGESATSTITTTDYTCP